MGDATWVIGGKGPKADADFLFCFTSASGNRGLALLSGENYEPPSSGRRGFLARALSAVLGRALSEAWPA